MPEFGPIGDYDGQFRMRIQNGLHFIIVTHGAADVLTNLMNDIVNDVNLYAIDFPQATEQQINARIIQMVDDYAVQEGVRDVTGLDPQGLRNNIGLA